MDYNFKAVEFKRAAAESQTPAERSESSGRPPDMRGEYSLDGRSATAVSLWVEQARDSGRPFLTGKLGANSLVDKLLAERGAVSAADVNFPVPPKTDIAINELRLWVNDKATADNKQPNWRGFARERDGSYVELSAYDRFDGLQGFAKPYRPYERPADAPGHEPGGAK
jgi:hypothetical protein